MRKRVFSALSRFSSELVRRKVYPVIVTYAVVAWVLLQIGEVTFGPLGFPDWVMTALVVLAIAGFPVAAILAWMFDIAPSGIRRDMSPAETGDDATTPSVAVLPFADMSQDKDQGYFCEGIAEEILNALTKIDGLSVVARMSSFGYASFGSDVREIGNRLRASAILEGSVRKSGNQLRVTAQLIKVSDGYHLWSKTFNCELKDIFAVQDEIATSIAESLLNTLVPVKTTECCDVTAYEFYLRGRQFLHRFRKVEIEYARQMFKQAIDRDPDFSAAWAGYADTFSLELMYLGAKNPQHDEARRASAKALELDPESAEAHASAGLASLVRADFAAAERELGKAIELNPNLYEAYYYFARTRFHQGDMDMAAEMFRKAAEVNPEDYQSRLLRVQILRGAGQREQAIEEAREAIAVVERRLTWHPDDVRALHLGAGSLILLGQQERADRWLRRALEVDPDDPILLYNVACNYATMNRVDAAFDALEGAVQHGAVSEDWMTHDEDLANLRDDPRYAALLRRIAKA